MSTTTTEGATSNKRSRTGSTSNDAPAAASGGSAAASATLEARLGSRLLPLLSMLASQPEELKGKIISLSREMLDLRSTIKQREESHARFGQSAKDPTTGAVLKDKQGNPIPFTPGSLKKDCPVEASKAMNNDPEMAALMEETKAMHATYTKKMTEQAEKVARLEIKLRYNMLRAKMYKLLDQCALARLVIAEIAEEHPTGVVQHSRQDLIHLTVYAVLRAATPAIADLLEVENGPKLADEYAEARNFDWNGLDSLATDDGDMMRINPIIALMQTWLPILTTAVWTQEDAKDRDRMIEAALRKEFKCQDLKEATEQVQDAMDEEDANLPNEKLSDLIDKGIKKELAKQVVAIKRQMKKNSSGGVESQTPKPGKNGQSSKKSSNASAAAKKNQQQQKSNPKKDKTAEQSKGKKRKESKAKSPSSNRPPKQRQRNQGSAGGSNGGGNKSGAARR